MEPDSASMCQAPCYLLSYVPWLLHLFTMSPDANYAAFCVSHSLADEYCANLTAPLRRWNELIHVIRSVPGMCSVMTELLLSLLLLRLRELSLQTALTKTQGGGHDYLHCYKGGNGGSERLRKLLKVTHVCCRCWCKTLDSKPSLLSTPHSPPQPLRWDYK